MRHYGLIGKKLSHSFSAKYFAEKFEREQIYDCSYSLYEIDSAERIKELIAADTELCGFNVTIPYKQDIIPLLDSLSFEAQCIGAVNCVKIHKNGTLEGHNTDIAGLRVSLDALLQGAEVQHALILGTGGASQAVQYLLSERGIPFELVSRDAAKATITYNSISAEVVEASHLIINTTPLGTYPDVDSAPSIPYAFISPSHFMLDLVYNPAVTQFLDYGNQRGARTLNGAMMLREQAEKSWRIWQK